MYRNAIPTVYCLLLVSALNWPARAQSKGPLDAPPILPVNIAKTPGTDPSGGTVQVNGTPRSTKGHPCTLWDQEDIDEIKRQLQTNKDLQEQFELIKKAMDKRLTEPLGVPQPSNTPPTKVEYRAHVQNSNVVSDMGTMYVLTGEEKYGDYCKQMLVEYARVFPNLPHTEGWTEKKYRSAQDGRVTGQFLEDGFWISRMARGADLVYNLPSWTPEERKLVKEDLFESICSIFYNPVIKDGYYLNQTHNRSAVCAASVLMAGYATDNQKLIDMALYGTGGTPENPVGGILGLHFSPKCILADGLWNEGAPGYQLGIASAALMIDAEVLWHHNIDLYRHNNGILKRLIDSSVYLAYPDSKLVIPALHDSGVTALLDDRAWFTQEAGLAFQYGYRRYRDPNYIPIIRNAAKSLSMSVHSGPTTLFVDLPPEENVPPRKIENVNYFAVGYGVLRLPAPSGHNQLLMEYGPSGSHGHPSKLGIDVYALDGALMPFPGVIFPYQDPMDPKWYWTTLANCALTIDEKKQVYLSEIYKYPRGTPIPEAKQVVFAPGDVMGMQRGWSNNLYIDKISQDRSLFLTANYMADLYAVSSEKTHKYDLAWHIRGQFSETAGLEPYTFPEPVENGYNALSEVKHVSTDKLWTIGLTSPNGRSVRFFSAGGIATEIITGRGHFFIKSSKEDEQPPTIIQRRKDLDNVIFGSATDLSGATQPYVKSIAQEGSIELGYALLKVETVKGTDLCFTALKQEAFKVGQLETDGLQAMVLSEGNSVCGLYLAGGKTLRYGSAAITRSALGLASIEKRKSGSYIIANLSPEEATLSVTLPGIEVLNAFNLDTAGRRQDAATVQKTAATHTIVAQLKAGAKIELTSASK